MFDYEIIPLIRENKLTTLKLSDVKKKDFIFTDTPRITLKEHMGNVLSLAVLPSGLLVSGCDDGTIKIWNTLSWTCIRTLGKHSNRVDCLAVLPGGQLVSGSDRIIEVWDTLSWTCIHTLSEHSDRVSSLAILPNGQLVSASIDGAINIWDTNTLACIRTLNNDSYIIWSLAALPGGLLVSGCDNGIIKVWDTFDWTCTQTISTNGNSILSLVVLPNGQLASGSIDGTIKVWDTTNWTCIRILNNDSHIIWSLAALPSWQLISGVDDVIHVWDLERERELTLTDQKNILRELTDNTSITVLDLSNIPLDLEAFILVSTFLKFNERVDEIELNLKNVDMSSLVTPLINKLGNEDEDGYDVRRTAAYALGIIAINSTVDMSAAVVPLINMLNNEDEDVRESAAYVLFKIAKKGLVDMSNAVAPLISKLDDENMFVRCNSSSALTEIAEKGTVDMSNAVALLINKLNNEDKCVRMDSSFILDTIARNCSVDMSNAVEPLINALQFLEYGENEDEIFAYLSTLSEISEKIPIDWKRVTKCLDEIIENLIVDLQSTDTKVRKHSSLYLGALASKNPILIVKAIDPLILRLEDENAKVRSRATLTLQIISQDNNINLSKAIRPLIALLKDGMPTSGDALGVLLDIFNHPKYTPEDLAGIVDILLNELKSEKNFVRDNIIVTMDIVLPFVDFDKAIDPLIGTLESETCKEIRDKIMCLLGELVLKRTPRSIRALDGLILSLENKDDHIRKKATSVLTGIIEKEEIYTPKIVDSLIKIINDKNAKVREAVILSLKIVCAKGVGDLVKLVAPLTSRLNDKNATACNNAVCALYEITKKVNIDLSGIIPNLINNLNNKHIAIRHNTTLLLKKIVENGAKDVTKIILPLITRVIKDPDQKVQDLAANVLGKIAEKQIIDLNGDVNGLIHMLRHSEYKQLAIFTLNEVVNAKNDYIDERLLVSNLLEPNKVHAAAFCLNEIIKRKRINIQSLEQQLTQLTNHKENNIKATVAHLLITIGKEEQGQNCLVSMLTESSDAAINAIRVLRDVGDSRILPLLRSLKPSDPGLSRLVKECIKELYQKDEMLCNVWKGKYGESSFTPVAKKTEGCSLGTIYEKEHTKPESIGPKKRWLGKPSHINKVTVREKISSDIYGYFGVTVPKTRLAYLEVGNKFTTETDGVCIVNKIIFKAEPKIKVNILWQELITNKYIEKAGIEHILTQKFKDLKSFEQMSLSSQFESLKENIYYMMRQPLDMKSYFYEQGKKSATFVMSKLVTDYSDLGENFIMGILRNEGRPPDKIFDHGIEIELRGLMKGLAVAKFLGDTDFLGGGGKNAGFVIKIDETGKHAEFIKIDPGEAFNFESSSRSHHVESSTHDPDMPGRKMTESKNMFIGNNLGNFIKFDKLSIQQRDEFIETMIKITEVSDRKIEYIVRRAGELGKTGEGLHKDEEDRTIKQLKERQILMKKLYGVDISKYKYRKLKGISHPIGQQVLLP